MHKIVLLRHGQSVWNREPKRFTGWTDVEISEKGIDEARLAGELLKKEGFVFDVAYCSMLKRAINTLNIVLDKTGGKNIPINYSWQLNERHYGALQGLTHEEMIKKYSPEQVLTWRRSYDVRPPLVEENDPRFPGNDLKYKDIPKELLPRGESLADTIKRVIPYWEKEILRQIKENKKVIIAASGNSLRALMKHLDNIGDEEIMKVEIATGQSLIYELETGSMKSIRHYYLSEI